MISRGADVPDEEIENVVNYLAKNFGASTEPAATQKNDGQYESVNVNKANATELAATLGLTPKEAEALVAYREQNGNFKEWRDLTHVQGIEEKKIESNKDRLVF
jgi:competence protein ComEA